MDAEPHLLSALRSHGSSLGQDEISWAFTRAKTADPVSSYVATYLTDANLLTAEESSIVNQLTKTGALPKLLQDHRQQLALSPPKVEATFDEETKALGESTRQLRAHTAQLQKQQQTLEAMRSRKKAERERRKKLEARRTKKWIAERDEMAAAVDDLLGIMKEEVADLRQTVTDKEAEIEDVSKVLESDDRVLARLGRLAGELVVPENEEDAEGKEALKRIEALVEKLAMLQEREVRTRLDRIYLETLASTPKPDEENDPAAIEALNVEIHSLYHEIPAVIRGAAYNSYLQPLHAAISAARRSRGENWIVGGEYICTVLSHLRNRNAAMTSFLTSTHDRDAAVLTLISTLNRESVSPLSTASETPRPTTPPSPRKYAPSSSSPTKLGRVPYLTPRHRRGRSIDYLAKDSAHPDLALLSHLGIALPGSSSSPTRQAPPPPTISSSFLSQQIVMLSSRVDRQLSAELPWYETETLAQAATVTRVLREALYTSDDYRPPDAEGGAMGLVREEVKNGVDGVERGVKEVAGVISGLVKKVDEIEAAGGDLEGKKAVFVGRWRR
jgi:hypothetical protein